MNAKLVAVVLILVLGGAYFAYAGVPFLPTQTVIGWSPYYQYASVNPDGTVNGYLAIQMILTPSTAIHFAYIGGNSVSGGTDGETTEAYPLPNIDGKTVNATTPIKIEIVQSRNPYLSARLQSTALTVTPPLQDNFVTVQSLELHGYEYSTEQSGWQLNVPFKIVVRNSAGAVLYTSPEYNLMSFGDQIEIGYGGIKIVQAGKPTNTVDQTKVPYDILILTKWKMGATEQNFSTYYYFDDMGTNYPSAFIDFRKPNSWARMIYGDGIANTPPTKPWNWGSYAGYTIGYDIDQQVAVWKTPWLFNVSYAPNDYSKTNPYYGIIDTLLNKDTRHNVPVFKEISGTFKSMGMVLNETAKTLSYNVSAFENSAYLVLYVPMELVGGRVPVEYIEVPDARITGMSIVNYADGKIAAGSQYTLKVDVATSNRAGDVVLKIDENLDYFTISPTTDGAYLGAGQSKSFYFTISTGIPPSNIVGMINAKLYARDGSFLDQRSISVTMTPIPSQATITVRAYATDVYGIRSEISAPFTLNGVRYTTWKAVQVPVGTYTVVFEPYSSGQFSYTTPAPVTVTVGAGENKLVEGVYQMVRPTESVLTIKATKDGQYVAGFSGQVVLADGKIYPFSTQGLAANVSLGEYTGIASVKVSAGLYEGAKDIVVAKGSNDITVPLEMGKLIVYALIGAVLTAVVVVAIALARRH